MSLGPSLLHSGRKFFCLLDLGIFVRFQANPRGVAINKFEGGFACRGVDSVVQGELGCGEERGPIILSLVYEVAEVLFDFLIDTFGLTIGLGVVGSGEAKLNPKHLG